MSQEIQVLFQHDFAPVRGISTHLFVAYEPETFIGSIWIVESSANLGKIIPSKVEVKINKKNPHNIEIKSPFTYEYWWSTYKAEDILIASQKQVILNLVIHTENQSFGFVETLEKGYDAPFGWEFKKLSLQATQVFHMEGLELFLQKIKGIENLDAFKVSTTGDLAKNIQLVTQRMKLKNAPPYAILEKIKKEFKSFEVNALSVEEKDAATEQLIHLANQMEYQFNNYDTPLRLINLANEITDISPNVKEQLVNAKNALIEQKNHHQKVAEETATKEKQMIKGNGWYVIAVVILGIVLYVIRFVLD